MKEGLDLCQGGNNGGTCGGPTADLGRPHSGQAAAWNRPSAVNTEAEAGPGEPNRLIGTPAASRL